MGDAELSQNLSEVLFKPKFQYPETSEISNSKVPLPAFSKRISAFGFSADWYRPVQRFLWVLSGGNALDIDEALAKISVSSNERSRADCLDTVREYGAGNWIFEFNSIAQSRVVLGRNLEDQNKIIEASHEYRMAARYFSIAAYPFLKGDTLAASAWTLFRNIYKKMVDFDPTNGLISEEFFNVGDKRVSGLLQLPDKKRIYPCVIIAGSYEQCISDYYHFYNNCLRPKGIAIFYIDPQGMGASEKLTLNSNLSEVAEAAIGHLSALPWIDSTAIGLFGVRLGAAACIRTAILQESKVRAVAVLEPAVNSIFTDEKSLESLPLCLRSSLANRLNLDASNWDTLSPQLKTLSLKVQGLLSPSRGCKVPLMSCSFGSSPLYRNDLALLNSVFRNNENSVFSDSAKYGYAGFIVGSLRKVAAFFEEKLV